jgi:hypothetical protein
MIINRLKNVSVLMVSGLGSFHLQGAFCFRQLTYINLLKIKWVGTWDDFSEFPFLQVLSVRMSAHNRGTFQGMHALVSLYLRTYLSEPWYPESFKMLSSCENLKYLEIKGDWNTDHMPDFTTIPSLSGLTLPKIYTGTQKIRVPEHVQELCIARARDILQIDCAPKLHMLEIRNPGWAWTPTKCPIDVEILWVKHFRLGNWGYTPIQSVTQVNLKFDRKNRDKEHEYFEGWTGLRCITLVFSEVVKNYDFLLHFFHFPESVEMIRIIGLPKDTDCKHVRDRIQVWFPWIDVTCYRENAWI